MNIKLLDINLEDIRSLLPEYGMIECDDDFELIITHGGDGALLGAERDYPNIPKLPLRDAATAPTCCDHEIGRVLGAFCSGKLEKSLLPKLCAESASGKLYAINDLFLHNTDRVSALRYRVIIDGKVYAAEVMGDGVCMSTVHGSTAYYRSITHSIFRTGIGLAFSNSTEAVDHLVLACNSEVEISVIRGPGMVVADNSPEQLHINVGESVKFSMVDDYAEIFGLDGFMCPECRKLRHRQLF